MLAFTLSSCSVSLDKDNFTNTPATSSRATELTAATTVTSEQTVSSSAEVTTTTTSAGTVPEDTEQPAALCTKVVSEISSVFEEGCLPVDLPITWIGDSYSAENVELLRERFSDLDLGEENDGNLYSPYAYVQFGKHMDWVTYPGKSESAAGGPSGADIIDGMTKVRPYLVFALGTNDPAITEEKMTATLDHIAEKVGNDTVVILTTAYIQGGGYFDAANEAKRKYSEEHGNFYTADWAAAATDDYYIQSEIHPYDNGGYNAWADLIYSTLLQIEKERQGR